MLNKITVDFSLETRLTRRQQDNIFKMLKQTPVNQDELSIWTNCPLEMKKLKHHQMKKS